MVQVLRPTVDSPEVVSVRPYQANTATAYTPETISGAFMVRLVRFQRIWVLLNTLSRERKMYYDNLVGLG